MKKTFIIMTTMVLASFITAVFLCVQALLAAQTVSSFAQGNMRIVLDAGHGGIDGGVTGKKTGVKESDLNLSITHCLKDVFQEMGFEVVLTRKTEAGLYGTPTKGFKKRDMERRKEIIEKAEPALVLSIHQNYYPSQYLRGGQVFYSAKKERSQALAKCLQGELNSLYSEERVKARNAMKGEYFMLECTPYPSVIVECGFLSNANDDALLTSKVWQEKLARAIAVGVMEYLSEFAA